MGEHTKEPWFVADWNDDNGSDLTTIEAREPEELFEGQSHIWPDGIAKKKVADTSEGNNPLEDARRIVACVNACQRLNTDLLERVTKNGGFGVHPMPQERIEELEQQRDDYKARALMREAANMEQGKLLNEVIAERDELLSAAELVLAWYEAEDDHSKEPDFYKRIEMCRQSEIAIRAAIAKAKP